MPRGGIRCRGKHRDGNRNPEEGRLTEEGNRPESMTPGGVKNRNGTTFPGEVRQRETAHEGI